jgi:hypothetical protein
MPMNPNKSRGSSTTTVLFIFIAAYSSKYVHSILIEPANVTLIKVDDIKPYNSASLGVGMAISLICCAFPGPSDLEIEPKGATLSVCVYFHQKIVLILIDNIG